MQADGAKVPDTTIEKIKCCTMQIETEPKMVIYVDTMEQTRNLILTVRQSEDCIHKACQLSDRSVRSHSKSSDTQQDE